MTVRQRDNAGLALTENTFEVVRAVFSHSRAGRKKHVSIYIDMKGARLTGLYVRNHP